MLTTCHLFRYNQAKATEARFKELSTADAAQVKRGGCGGVCLCLAPSSLASCQAKLEKAWDAAEKRLAGKKVKDDPKLLAKALKRREQKKKKSQKLWYVCFCAPFSFSAVAASAPCTWRVLYSPFLLLSLVCTEMNYVLWFCFHQGCTCGDCGEGEEAACEPPQRKPRQPRCQETGAGGGCACNFMARGCARRAKFLFVTHVSSPWGVW